MRTPDFVVERISVSPGATLHQRGSGTPVAWTLLDGSIGIAGTGSVGAPATVLLPADRAPLSATSDRGCTLLQVHLPDPVLDASPAPPARQA